MRHIPAPMIVVPAYNEEAHIASVVRRSKPFGAVVLVVDDGSADRTVSLARQAGADVIVHETNQGNGGALATGFAEAEHRGVAWVVTLDGDGQHDPAEIPRFLAAAAVTGADIVIGSRTGDLSTMPRVRRR